MKAFSWLYTGVKVLLAICLGVIALYAHMERQNELVAICLKIPLAARELKEIEESNRILQLAIDKFENSEHLQSLLLLPAYSHLCFPTSDQVFVMPKQKPLIVPSENQQNGL